MLNVVTKEGHYAPLFYSGMLSLCLVTSVFAADTVQQTELETCAAQKSAELKLACYEAITASGRPSETVTKSSPNLDPESEPELAAMYGLARDTAVSTTTIDSAAGASTLTEIVVENGEKADLGKEHLPTSMEREERSEPQSVVATVTKVSRDRSKKLTFEFSNGHVWRQMEPGYIQYPKDDDFEVEITQGMMGDYRLRVDAKGRMTRIVRIK